MGFTFSEIYAKVSFGVPLKPNSSWFCVLFYNLQVISSRCAWLWGPGKFIKKPPDKLKKNFQEPNSTFMIYQSAESSLWALHSSYGTRPTGDESPGSDVIKSSWLWRGLLKLSKFHATEVWFCHQCGDISERLLSKQRALSRCIRTRLILIYFTLTIKILPLEPFNLHLDRGPSDETLIWFQL